jgi:hypothetical protein
MDWNYPRLSANPNISFNNILDNRDKDWAKYSTILSEKIVRGCLVSNIYINPNNKLTYDRNFYLKKIKDSINNSEFIIKDIVSIIKYYV